MEASEAAFTSVAGFAHAYSETGEDLRGIDATVDTYGGGGLVSTVGDLTLFLRALFEGQIVSSASLASMLQSGPNGYGRGIYTIEASNQTCWGHSGFWGAAIFYCPSSKTSVAVTINVAVTGDGSNPAVTPALNPNNLAISLLDLGSR